MPFRLRKRFEKAEAEYVSAKLDLHRKTEVKEQLTEHLCAIIQQNELRKAHKLEELMQQLQLQATEEEEEEVEKEEEEGRRNGEEALGKAKEGSDSSEKQKPKEHEPKDSKEQTEKEAASEQEFRPQENCVPAEAVDS